LGVRPGEGVSADLASTLASYGALVGLGLDPTAANGYGNGMDQRKSRGIYG